MGYQIYVRNKKKKAYEPGWWDNKKRLEVVTTYLTCGDGKLTSAMTGVPYDTIRTWKKQPWWKEYIDELSTDNTAQLDNKLQKIMDKALDQVMDRLENGEFMYDPRTGQVKRIPAKLRDTGKILNDVIDKRQLIKKQELMKENQKQQAVTTDHLIQLAKAFAEFSSGKKESEVPKTIIDGEIINTEYEVTQYGLQNENKEAPEKEVSN